MVPDKIANAAPDVAVWPFTVTVMKPLVAPAGMGTTMDSGGQLVGFAGVPLKPTEPCEPGDYSVYLQIYDPSDPNDGSGHWLRSNTANFHIEAPR